MGKQHKTKEITNQEVNKLLLDFSFLKSLKIIDDAKRKQLEKELAITLKELTSQNKNAEKLASELIITKLNIKYENEEKLKRAEELVIANIELAFQNSEKIKRAAELAIANKELAFQNEEKEKRAAELILTNKELAFQSEEREKRAAELAIANKELAFQNEEKEKRAAELAIAKMNAEESNRLKSAFLANMSHEIRTPMNGILGFSEILKKPNLSGEQQHKYIEIIEKSGKRMLNIINDIVDISKIEAGLMKMDIKESNINEQVEYIYTFFKPEVEAKGMQLFFKKTLQVIEATIKTDREKLFAILTNLVKNAIKYSNEGSIEFGYEKKGDYLEFFVKDTGIGIPKDSQKSIFQRFNQVDITNKAARQGAGLGLSITKAYIEMLGGKIWVESEEGIGSTFYFTLPYNPELKGKINVKDIEVTDNSENQIKNLKVLIAEDDETSGMLLNLHLSEFSNKILEAITGREAIEVCRNNPDIDLILMDIQMPGLNGYEATRHIRQFNKDVVIIAQTAFGLAGDREKSLDAGCNDYITKPINKPELDSLIEKYFNKKS